MSRDINPFGLRMPQKLKELLEVAAEVNGRSLNSEIVQRLERSFSGQPSTEGWTAGKKGTSFPDKDLIESIMTVLRNHGADEVSLKPKSKSGVRTLKKFKP